MPRARTEWKGVAATAFSAMIACVVSQPSCSSSSSSSAGDDGGALDSSAGSSGAEVAAADQAVAAAPADRAVAAAVPARSGGSSTGGSSGGSSDGGSEGSPDGGGDAGTVQPYGNIPGTWTLAFDDEFNGTTLDTTKWTTMSGGGWGSTTCETANVSVSGGNLALTLASASSGGCVCTGGACAPAFGGSFNAGSGSYNLPVGGYTEARVDFPGSGTAIYNWPAWWTSGPGWPAAGEHDIAEGLGKLTVTYHSPSGAHGLVALARGHVVERVPRLRVVPAGHLGSLGSTTTGKRSPSYSTDDNGAPELHLLVDVMDGYGQAVYGAGSQVLVDYIRAWQ